MAKAAGIRVILKSRTGPKQRKLLKTMNPKRRKPLKPTTETTQVAENEVKQTQAL
jgi:hypothetical protein